MKRGLITIIIAVLLIAAAGFAWHATHRGTASTAAVTALLPRDTIALAHLPDLNRTRAEWKQSDVYQLYAEPAVQEFLRNPLAQQQNASPGESAKQMEQLGIRDAFAAITSIGPDNLPRVVAGFRFSGKREDAEKFIARWQQTSSRVETTEYQQHKIDVFNFGVSSLAETFDGHWFFAGTNVDDIKAMLDRADNRVADRNALLVADETFVSTMSVVPSNYDLGLYLRMEKIAARLAALGSQPTTAPQPPPLGNVRAIAATSRFEKGKIHDHFFAALSNPGDERAKLSRASLALSSPDTFLYAASVLNFSNGIATMQPTAGAGLLGGLWQKAATAIGRSGIKAEDWQAVFGSETEVLADWPTTAHWPSGVAVFPVKDSVRARKIASALAHALDEDATWIETDRNGAHLIAMQSAPGFLTLRPCLAVLENMMIVGLDPGSVEAVLERSRGSVSGLADSAAFKSASASVPAPTVFFAYLDLSVVYARIDASLRPLLLMGAAFMPKVNNYVDLARLPAVEVVTKHLSPIVTSQRQTGGGYLAESVGPITLSDAGLALLFFGVMHREAWSFPMALNASRSRPSQHGGSAGRPPSGMMKSPVPTATP
jgi:hypothetical protein